MENHAFDHMLGCMDLPGADGIPPGGRLVPIDPNDASKGFVNVSCGTSSYVCKNGPGYSKFDGKFKPGAQANHYPWVAKGAVFQEPKQGPFQSSQFDLTSLIATARTLFNLTSPLTKRDAWAASFEELLLDSPRSDAPMHLPDAPPPAKPWHEALDDDDDDGAATFSMDALREAGVILTQPARRLGQDAIPQHCSATSGVCKGPKAVTAKQLRNIELYAHLTQRPKPSADTLTFRAADRWLNEHWQIILKMHAM